MNPLTAGGPHGPSSEEIKAATSRLIELSIKWSSDKYYRHSYIENSYGRLFAGRKVNRVCEIGIGMESLMQPFLPKGVMYRHGSSLKMWSEFWPEADIYACDIRADVLVNEGRIKSWVVDQSNEMDLERLIANCGGKCDVIIDDGSHQFEHQRISARALLPWVMPMGGVYVIEDTYPDKGRELADEFGGELIVGTKTPDDCLVVIRK